MKMNGLLPEANYAECANGYRIHYIDEGEGDVVVFLHGSGPGASGHSNFKGNYPALVEAGAKVNYIGKDKQTALLAAAKSGSTKVVAYLVSKGAKVNHRSKAGTSALKIAVMSENVEMAKLLLSKGADATMPAILSRPPQESECVRFVVDPG